MKRRTAVALTAALALTAGAIFVVPAFADSPVPQRLADQLANCQDMLEQAKTAHERAWAEDCVSLAERAIAAVPAPSPTLTTAPPTPTPTATAPPTPTATPTPTPTVAPTTPPPAPTWPGAANTGVPSGVTLQPYTGSCTITAANTAIVGRTIGCGPLYIRAEGVAITNSRVNGWVRVESGSLVMTDSEISSPAGQTGIDGSNYTVTRGDIFGGNRQGNCDRNCTVNASWLHGTRLNPVSQHASGFRMGQYTTLTGNTITCEALQNSSGGGCSAPITGYPDTMPIHHNTVVGNWIPGSPGSAFCAYGGATSGKPYSNDSTNATYVIFKDNVFGRGTSGKCAIHGLISDFAKSRTGNEWVNNRFEDGAVIGV